MRWGLRNGKFITTRYGSGNEFVTEEELWQSFDSSNVMMNGKFLVLWKKTRKDGSVQGFV